MRTPQRIALLSLIAAVPGCMQKTNSHLESMDQSSKSIAKSSDELAAESKALQERMVELSKETGGINQNMTKVRSQVDGDSEAMRKELEGIKIALESMAKNLGELFDTTKDLLKSIFAPVEAGKTEDIDDILSGNVPPDSNKQ